MLIIGSGAVTAGERKLTGPEIEAMLADVTVTGKAANGDWKQHFSAQGQTTYVGPGEAPSSGNWRVKGDQYCSVWPPSGNWVCYGVEADPEAMPPSISWVGESGTRYPVVREVGRGHIGLSGAPSWLDRVAIRTRSQTHKIALSQATRRRKL
jgi:hypothetical protein